ncbi:MAG: hypothetical protein ACI9FN_001008, partial [Saprospiraceae bacterium]
MRQINTPKSYKYILILIMCSAFIVKMEAMSKDDLSIASKIEEVVLIPPVNDDLCDAITLIVGDPCSGFLYSNIDATNETAEPFGCSPELYNTVWFSFVATVPGGVVINTTSENPGSIERALFAENMSFDCSDLNTLVEVDCNNDDDQLNTLSVCGLVPGDTYYVRIQYPDATEDGNFCLEINEGVGPDSAELFGDDNICNGASVFLFADVVGGEFPFT